MTEDERTEDGKWKIGQCSVGPETAKTQRALLPSDEYISRGTAWSKCSNSLDGHDFDGKVYDRTWFEKRWFLICLKYPQDLSESFVYIFFKKSQLPSLLFISILVASTRNKFEKSSWRSQSGILIFEGHGTPPPPNLPYLPVTEKYKLPPIQIFDKNCPLKRVNQKFAIFDKMYVNWNFFGLFSAKKYIILSEF